MALASTRSDSWIKIRVLVPPRVNIRSNLTKIFEELGFDVKAWKMSFGEDSDLVWILVNPRLTRGILVNLTRKGTLSAPMPEQVTLSLEKKNTELEYISFLELNMYIRIEVRAT